MNTIAIWGNELPAWVSAAMLAQAGNRMLMVTDSDLSCDPVALMDSPIHNEPGLKALVVEQYQCGQLGLIDRSQALSLTQHMLSLRPEQFAQAMQITQQLAERHQGPLLIINQSHFGVGYSDQLQEQLNPLARQDVVYLAESLSAGSALQNMRHPSAITAGGSQPTALAAVYELLKPFCPDQQQFLAMSAREAEFAKFSVTGMLAVRLGFINELANLAEKLGVDIEVVRQSMMADPRIGPHFLSPGCGFGGSAFSQTIQGLADLLNEQRQTTVLDTVLRENEKQKEQPFRKLWQHYECDIHGLNITLWGVSFKPGSASLQSAPSLRIIDALLAQQANVRAHDPEALPNLQQRFGHQLHYYQDPYQALHNSDALLLLTQWPQYNQVDFQRVRRLMRQPLVIDGRNLYERQALENLGFSYYGVGR